MKLSFLSPLYARPGPFSSVYLDTSQDGEEAEQSVELRWRRLREELLDHGTDQATIGALGHVAGSDRGLPGPHGQAIFAAHGRLALAEELPEPPTRDSARTDMLPDAMPLAVQHAPDIPYAALTVHRTDPAEPGTHSGTHAGPQTEELEVDLQVGRWPMSRVAAGVLSRRRVSSDCWSTEARQVLGELAGLADSVGAELVVLAGAPRERAVLVRDLPRRLRDRIVTVDGDGHAADSGRALLEKELADLFHSCLSTRDRIHLTQFLAQRARLGAAAEGLTASVAAVRLGRAQALLLNPPARFGQRLWVGMAPTQVALTEGELHALGPRAGWQEPADAALIRAVVGTGAELVVVPAEELSLEGGVGVLLREEDESRSALSASGSTRPVHR